MSAPIENQSEDRTNLALDRTVLANERTYAAWIRTGLTALAAGMGTAKFMTGLLPTWGILAIAGVLIAFSATAFVLAAWRYRHLHLKVSRLDVDAIPRKVAGGMSLLLAACSVIALVSLWTLAN